MPAHSFGPSMRLLAEAVGLPLGSVTSTGEVALTREKLTIAAGTLDAAIPEGMAGEMTPGYTANRAVNAVSYVCAAPAGIRSTVDLSQIVPNLTGVR